MWVVVSVVMVVMVLATYLTWTATRVDRLHVRVTTAFSALDAHLVRRAAAGAELADRRGSMPLQAAAKAALAAHPDDRESAENDLTRVLRAAAESPPLAAGRDGSADNDAAPVAQDPFATVVEASRRVALARQVHNDLVRDALAQRRRPVVRLLRFSRHHPPPRYFDIDDPRLDRATQ
jgi:hypothetical protein